MSRSVNAWRRDTEGWYIEMFATARKDFTIDWTEWLDGEAVASAQLTLDANLTQVGNTEIAAGLTKFTLIAAGIVGDWRCSMKLITASAGNIEPLPFRVRIR